MILINPQNLVLVEFAVRAVVWKISFGEIRFGLDLFTSELAVFKFRITTFRPLLSV